MQGYGTPIERVASYLAKRQPGSDDPSQDALIHLALALDAVDRLTDQGAELVLQGRPLVAPSIRKAYQEMLFVRGNLPHQQLDVSVISRFGRLVADEGKVQSLFNRAGVRSAKAGPGTSKRSANAGRSSGDR